MNVELNGRRKAGRVAIVTGGASGIGRATTERLASEGARLIVADVQEEAGAVLCESLRRAGGDATFVRCDVNLDTQVRDCVTAAASLSGRIDILVNVAGGSSASTRAHEMPIEEFERVLSLNLHGTFRFLKNVLPYMESAGYGRIVNVSSTAAFVMSDRTTPAYASAKAAIIALTRQLVFNYSRHGITANVVAPGHIRTPIALRLGEAALQARARLIPAGRIGEPEDVAALVAFLASDEASFITGQTVVIDGGQTSVMNYSITEAP